MSNDIAGVILAAGESSRMGRDKALLPLGDSRGNFVEHLIDLLRGEVSPLVVVLGYHAAEIESRIGSDDVIVLRNPNYKLGQLSSLHVALRYLENSAARGALVCLVDHPAITPNVVRSVIERFETTGAPIVIPTYQDRRGHPIVFARSLFQELLDAPLDEGARFVVRKHAGEVEFVETDEEGILLDIDLPADYERLLKRGRGNTE